MWHPGSSLILDPFHTHPPWGHPDDQRCESRGALILTRGKIWNEHTQLPPTCHTNTLVCPSQRCGRLGPVTPQGGRPGHCTALNSFAGFHPPGPRGTPSPDTRYDNLKCLRTFPSVPFGGKPAGLHLRSKSRLPFLAPRVSTLHVLWGFLKKPGTPAPRLPRTLKSEVLGPKWRSVAGLKGLL